MRVLPKIQRIESDADELERYWITQNCENAIIKGAEFETINPPLAKLYRFVEGLCVKALDRLGGGSKGQVDVDSERLEKANLLHSVTLPAVQTLSQILVRMLADGKPREINGIVFASGHEAHKVSAELLLLELSGKVKKLSGGRYKRNL